MRIAILSFYSQKYSRGVENWAENLSQRIPGIQTFSGWKSYNPLLWTKAAVIIPTNGRLQVLLSRIVTWLTGKPLVVFGHSGPGADDKWNLLCSPNVFVVFSAWQKTWAEKYKLPWTKIILIHHAVDTIKFHPASSKPNDQVILCVAAREPAKRTILVEQAVCRISRAKLLLVGSGQPQEVSFEQMPALYHKADVFCFVPQPWEAFGLVFLEALASNLPVVTIDDPVRREIVGQAGIFVANPQDPMKLAAAIQKAIDTDWKNKPRQQAEKFSWDKIAPQYGQLFKNI